MSVAGASSAPNSAGSNISSSQSPLQMQQQHQTAGVPFPTYHVTGEPPEEQHLTPDKHRIRSPSSLSNPASNQEPHRTISNESHNSTERQLDAGMMPQMYQQQQHQQYLSGMDARLFNHNNMPSTTSPFQQYGNSNAQYPTGMMDIGMGIGMEDMIGKWMNGVDGGLLQNGLNGALVGNIGPLSNLAAAAGYPGQQQAGGMSQADRQAWLAKSIFGGHQQGESVGVNAMGNVGMGMFAGAGQDQLQHHQQHSGQSRAPDGNPQTYGMGMQNVFSSVNAGFPPYVSDSVYGNISQLGQVAGGMENPMGYRQSDFDLAGMNTALAGMQLGLGETLNSANDISTGRLAGIANAGAGHGPPSISSGRGSMNSGSAPGSALSQLSAGSAGTGLTSFSGGSGPGAAIGNDREDLIPTAIVIKNIPFDVVKEKMLEVISSLGAPLPYAFNYHYENNQFRGLAFANFRQPFEADSVVAALNGYDLFGRKLRVEYKKVLQIGEKERIEKEKAIRRMKSAQLNRGGGTGNTTPNSANHSSFASQQRPGFNGVPAMPSFNLARAGGQGWHSRNLDNDSSNPAAYVSQYGRHPEDANRNSIFENSFQQNIRDQSSQSDSPPSSANLAEHPSSNSDFFAKEQEQPVRVDHTDPWTFDMHTKLVMFMADRTTDETTFSSNLSPREKKIIHALAERLGLQHSDAEGRVVIGKVANPAPNQPQLARPTARGHGAQPGTYLHPHAAGGAAGPSLRNRTSMPNLNGMNNQSSGHREPSRLLSRQSNQNLRDFAMRTGNPHSASSLSHQQSRRPFAGANLQPSQGFNNIFGSSMGYSTGSALEIVPSPTSPSDPSMPSNLALPSRGFAANRTSFRSRHGSTESARNTHASGVIGSQRPSSVTGIAPLNAVYKGDDRSAHTSGSSVIEEEDTSAEDNGSRDA